MSRTDPAQTKGRDRNAAQPLGQDKGIASDQERGETGEASRRKAGPDGPDAKAVGDTFKH